MADRPISFVTRGLRVPDAEGEMRRYVGTPECGAVDPFILCDWFETDAAGAAAGFAPHPHRGIDTLTLMLEGGMEHHDNLGNVAAVGPGGAQLMRAGRGLVHAERPLPENGRLFGLQLWINLSRADKTAEPDYQSLPAEAIPTEQRAGADVRVVMGRTEGTRAVSAPRATDPVVLDVTIAPGASFSEPVAGERGGFVIVVAGALTVGGVTLERGALGVLGDGDALSASSADGGRFVLLTGLPIGEPVARSGPFVLTTRAEVLQAYRDYRAGGFGPRIALPSAIS